MPFGLVLLKHSISEKGYFSNSQQEGVCRVSGEVQCAVYPFLSVSSNCIEFYRAGFRGELPRATVLL